MNGILAINFLKENLAPASYDDIIELLKIFPEDVIEFSCYEIFIGNLPHRNHIIWEVRGY